MAVLLVIGTSFSAVSQNQELDKIYEGIEFDMPRVKETSFPDYAKRSPILER